MRVPSLAAAIADKKILVCVGSGGVGKTSTAAAVALAAALAGKRTLVLTIDPAKRLANSLGLRELGHEVRQVDPALLARCRGADVTAPLGELHAMMLDQKRAFDDVVARHASDPAAVKRIMSNPVYGQVSGSLAGAQEYAAMAALHDFDKAGTWDLIVVDTPPTSHALDFLDAPQKLAAAIDSPAIEWFRKLTRGGGGWSLIGRTGGFVMKRLAKFVGERFIDDLSVFFTEFHQVLGGFRVRAEQTFGLLRQAKVGFVMVASPEPMAMAEATAFHQRLREAQMPVVGFVVNKVHAGHPTMLAADPVALAHALGAQPAVGALGLSETALVSAARAFALAHGELEARAAADAGVVADLRRRAPDTLIVSVPLQREDVHDLDRLVALAYALGALPAAAPRSPEAAA